MHKPSTLVNEVMAISSKNIYPLCTSIYALKTQKKIIQCVKMN